MSSIVEIAAATAVEIVLFGVAGGVLYRVWRGAHFLPQRKTLLPFNKGVILQGETIARVVEPGTYWIAPKQTMVPVDVRPRPFQMPLRDVATLDGQGLRIRVQGEFKVVEAGLFLRGSSDGSGAFYLSVNRETALAVADLDKVEILAGRVSLADRIRERMEPRAAQLGIVITQLEVSDLFPISWT